HAVLEEQVGQPRPPHAAVEQVSVEYHAVLQVEGGCPGLVEGMHGFLGRTLQGDELALDHVHVEDGLAVLLAYAQDEDVRLLAALQAKGLGEVVELQPRHRRKAWLERGKKDLLAQHEAEKLERVVFLSGCSE